MLNDELVKEDIKNVMTSILSSADAELQNLQKDELEQFYFFKWEDKKSIEWNTYQFQDLLDLYKKKCRRWEETHNGSCCVVERVRDTYLIPKIREFCETMKTKIIESDK